LAHPRLCGERTLSKTKTSNEEESRPDSGGPADPGPEFRAQTHSFQTETRQVLRLMILSLYSN
jgi:hypothetical protein